MASTVEILKTNQERTALKLADVSNNFREFQYNVNQAFENKYDKTIKTLEGQMRKLKLGLNTSFGSSNYQSPTQAKGFLGSKMSTPSNRKLPKNKRIKGNFLLKLNSLDVDELDQIEEHPYDRQQNQGIGLNDVDMEEVKGEIEKSSTELELKLMNEIRKAQDSLMREIEIEKEASENSVKSIKDKISQHLTDVEIQKSKSDFLDREFIKLSKEIRGESKE